ncbi:ExeM/NucH family extracellular endonuclease, partial [Paraglaciecola sp.]|uniref:ExeM/NucH family extracellular endonuclease n=1 Tax=Paraglaciecola sp. TaxID=1920173 RepID=UPI00273EB3D1
GGGDTGGGDTGGGDTGGGDTGGDTGGGDTNAPITLFISEYIEGSSNNKAIEIYNNSSQSVDLSAENVVLARFSNGGTTASNINLTGTIAAFGTHVIAHTSANDQIKALADQLSGSVSHNGDDAYTLLVDGVVVDSFGQVGNDPGSSWGSDTFSTANNTLRRNPNVLTGDIIVDDEFDPSLEWSGFGNDVADGLGEHSVDLGEIFISEYIEGSSNNKALEFYNPNSVAIDLTPYSLLRSANGGTSEAIIDLVGSIAPYDVFVIANNSSVTAILDVADQLNSNINHNGDDAYVLYNDGVVIDSFGRVGERAVWGSGDTTSQNHTLVRKSSVKQGDAITDDAFDPALEWDGFAQDTFEFLGSYGSNGGDTGGETVVLGQCADPATLISSVQGNGAMSPLVGETHVLEAVVSASFANLSGFFIQEQTADMDADIQTSEGIFVYYSGELPTAGTVVRVLGKVEEYFDKTQLNVTTAPLDCGVDSVTATSLSLPFADAEFPESLEGMLVSTSSELTVTDNYSLGRYGEVALSNGRLFVPTNIYPAGSEEAIALAAQNALNKITLDDGMNGSNPDPVIYPTGNLSANNTLRGGDIVSSLTGVMDYSFSLYRIIPTEAPTFVANNPRTAAPELTLGNLKVASLNVLNLFNGDGQGAGFPTSRGALTAAEFERQLTKTVAALAAMDADIVGLMEIENDGFDSTSAIAELTSRLNAVVGTGVYTFVDGGGVIGTDEIKVAMLYKPSKVSPVGGYKVLTSSNSITDEQGPLFVDTKNRPSFNQKFALIENAQEIVVSVNHLKSKGSTCGVGDDDTSTGQGNCNLTRTRAAEALTAFLAQEYPDSPTLIIGDLNAYAQEDPILKIKEAGYTDLANLFKGADAYSYAFGGEYGYLDHALANQALLDKVVDTTEWHINADEPTVLDYNFGSKSEQQISDFYAPDAYRMSDHDPVV